MLPLLVALGACNAAFSGLVLYIVVRGVSDRFVAHFLFAEYFAAMVPISIIAILEPQTLGPIIAILLINIGLLIMLGVLPKYFRRN
jgi:hypothetical protein